jgi:Lactate racemase N-terminal domain
MPTIEILVGRKTWPFTVRDGSVVTPSRPAIPAIDNVRAVVAQSLEHPLQFEAFRRAITPDDRIALVVDESLPRLTDLVAGVLDYLVGCGISPEQVTALSPAKSMQDWAMELPDTYSELRTEVHQPADRNALSYLGTSKEERKIYINRTIVDADQVIVLAAPGYDPLSGRSGGTSMIYPTFADTDAMKGAVHRLSPRGPDDGAWPLAEEAKEVTWMLGHRRGRGYRRQDRQRVPRDAAAGEFPVGRFLGGERTATGRHGDRHPHRRPGPAYVPAVGESGRRGSPCRRRRGERHPADGIGRGNRRRRRTAAAVR